MGLTNRSVGINAIDLGLDIKKVSENDKVIALAGNPNVGKSTLFNNLTGLRQHTGNWSGKTVSITQGYCSTKENSFVMVDIPGTYSLMAHSTEEEVARNFMCFGSLDAIVVVCDATCLERNLNLVLQCMEFSNRVLLCVNLLDEANKKGIKVDLDGLSRRLGIPVVGTIAYKKKTLNKFKSSLDSIIKEDYSPSEFRVSYNEHIEKSISMLQPIIEETFKGKINSRWLSLRLLDYDTSLINEVNKFLDCNVLEDTSIAESIAKAKEYLLNNQINDIRLKDEIVSSLVHTAEKVCKGNIEYTNGYNDFDRKLDKVLTSKWAGYPIMMLLLIVIFWITITGANYPSQILSKGLFWFQDRLSDFFHYIDAPIWIHNLIVLGIYRVLAWVVSVMLPPMAIFFPMFTLLEDSGYLPRIAYNLDKPFKKCSACGKQSLTMCMGFGCNSTGIVGCRIIDSPRERLIAMLTNNFVPCNGRFPMLISIITMFFVGFADNLGSSIVSSLILTGFILVGIIMTFITSKLLSKTILKGVPSSFTLELPSYRKPQILKTIVHSIFDRTIFILGRAIVVTIPAGIVIWLMANVYISDTTILNHCANFLNPFAELIGLDGFILMAFILGLPANEIVLPIIIMAYTSQGSIMELSSLSEMKDLFIANGWTWITAISTMLFSLIHFPCATTLMTIRKETNSLKWTILAFIIPTIMGIIVCFIFSNLARLFI